MVKDYKISTPFFEFGPKAYLYGEELLELMKKIDGFAQKYDMDVIADVQTTDLRLIAENTSSRIHVYSQHMDSIPVGRGMGTILPEAVKAAGYCGTLDENLCITFPANTMLISMADYQGGGLYQSNKNGLFKVDLSTTTIAE